MLQLFWVAGKIFDFTVGWHSASTQQIRVQMNKPILSTMIELIEMAEYILWTAKNQILFFKVQHSIMIKLAIYCHVQFDFLDLFD